MTVPGVRILLAPETTALVLGAIAVGVACGTLTGLTPGLHANNVALLLAGVAPAVPAPPLAVAVAVLATGIVHTFLDIVPSLALGVPDPAMAATALPGHRLVLQGRGREALRLSAIGSATALPVALVVAVPLTAAMVLAWETIAELLPVIFGLIVASLIWLEPTRRARIGAGLTIVASGALGVAVLDLGAAGDLIALGLTAEGLLPAGSMFAPLFAGLFGAPVLIDAIGSAGIPPQADAVVAQSRRAVGRAAGVGALAGAVVGYIPGVSSAIAATFALLALDTSDRGGERAFVVAASAVNTSNAIFAIFAFYALSDARTGILVAVKRIGAPQAIPIWLAAVAIAAVAGALLVLVVGDRYLAAVGRVDPTWLSVGVLGLLVVLSVVFAGPVGIAVFAASTLIGLIPVRFGARRASCMGVLLVPLAL